MKTVSRGRRVFLIVWLAVIAALLVAIFAIGLPAGHSESIKDAMRDGVLHDENRVAVFGLRVDPGLISAWVMCAVLLIAACLSREGCAALTAEAHRLGLEVLLEIHSAEELDYITPEVDVVGVNNRHLGSFVTDVKTSFDMAPLLSQRADRNPPSTTPTHTTGQVFISESGISSPETVRQLREAGFRGFLMGETFMKEPDPGAALATFIQAL